MVARPIGNFKSSSDFHYQTVRCNVDLLKIIQFGITLCNEEGELAPGICTYQFNFKFSLGCADPLAARSPKGPERFSPSCSESVSPTVRSDDVYAQDSIDLLTRSGIDFEQHEERGIDPMHFAELLMCSGIVLCDDVAWITFHAGYDFAYLLKLLTCKPLPQVHPDRPPRARPPRPAGKHESRRSPLLQDEEEFFADLQLYCPRLYDMKYLMRFCENLKGGLNKLAEDISVERVGPEHTAGSDSLLTQATFFKLRSLFFEGELDETKHANILFGLGRGAQHSAAHAYES